ncbi:MAG: rRNA cytosine-C5-methyltransferase [Balneolales bacterium]|nr:rRNA cytosine-C5-methyltransferase [Balneolales bacterium]
MIENFKKQTRHEHPEIAEKLLDSLGSATPVSVRVNKWKFDSARHGFPAPVKANVNWESDGFYLGERPVFTLDPLFHAGGYYVQEASSRWAGNVMRQLKNGPVNVLDLCAAPGGKSTHLASVLESGDLLVTNEVHRSRVQVLTENMIKWGAPNVVVTSNEASHFQSIGSWFDIILVDAPCSGEGLFRRDPNAMTEWSPEAVTACSVRQQQILTDIWPALKPGGFLIYSTCTFNKSENDAQVQQLVSGEKASSVRIQTDPATGIIEDEIENDVYMYRCFPGFVEGEGFTFSVLRKSTDTPVTYGESRNKARLRKEKTHPFADALKEKQDFTFLANDKQFFAVPGKFARKVMVLDDILHIHHAGVELGDEKRPGQSLAMSTVLHRGFFEEIAFTKDEALDYLRRQSVSCDRSEHGIRLLTHQGLPLGFGKAVKGRINNHYPVEWRIRNL